MERLLTVRRWRRYGADRLFVTQEGGLRLGSVDLQSGEVVVDDPVLEDRLRRAAQAYLRGDADAELVLNVPSPSTADLGPRERAAIEAWLGADDDEPYRAPDERASSAATLAERLELLAADGWKTLHDVPLGRQGTVVRHLLVGPGGIFTIGERSHPGARVRVAGRSIEVDGQPVPYLRDARLEAARVHGMLTSAGCAGIAVRAVLVVTGDLEVDGRPHDGLVLRPEQVPTVFRRMDPRVDAGRVASIARLAGRPTTWTR